MTHYICSECGDVSTQPGLCRTENCMQQGASLKMCNCEDNIHANIMNTSGTSSEDTEQPASNVVDLDNGEIVN
jgi:hypothetical protein